MSETNSHRGASPPPLPQSFFYNNIFQNENVANALSLGVRTNLTPFRDLLDNLIKCNNRLENISADISPIDGIITLKPEFYIVRLDIKTKYEMPEGKHYILEWETKYGDIEEFIEISNRNRDFILTAENKIDFFEGYAIFESEHEPNGALTLYYNREGEEKNALCEIRPIDFEYDFGKYRIKSSEKILHLHCDKNAIIIPNIMDKELVLFDSIKIKKIMDERISDAGKFSADNKKQVQPLENGVCIVYDNNVEKLFYEGKPVNYKKEPLEEYPHLLGDKNIIVNGGSLTLEKNIITDGSYHSNHGTTFNCKMGRIPISPKFREGIFVSVEDDGSLESDFSTSASLFFREDIEKLTNDERNREFLIGKKIEEDSVIEIVEIIKDKRVKVIDIPKKLYLVSNPYQLIMQKNAINRLIWEPSVHHGPLLKLMDSKVRWGNIDKTHHGIREWYVLKDGYDGVIEQREMTKLALCTKDFAFLEGPPGSGKTTTILEIVAQMIDRGERVMLAASTHAAIDNILERLNKLPDRIKNKILAVRIGNESNVSETVDHYRPENINDEKLRDVIFERANLVCGTTFGVLRHPEFNLNEKNKMTPPLFDCLIVDEASKTTFQEFLVPAIFARKWILSGDIRQLTPYIEKQDIASSIRQMNAFNEKLQGIQWIIQQLSIDNKLGKCRFCIPITQQSVTAFMELVPQDEPYLCISTENSNNCISAEELLSGGVDAHKLYGAKYIFVQEDYFDRIVPILPNDVIVLLKNKENGAWISHYANEHYFENKRMNVRIGRSEYKNPKDLREAFNSAIRSKDWAGEIAWRIGRQQELFMLSKIPDEKDKVESYGDDIEKRVPKAYHEKINEFLDLIRELALPSILQLLKEGINENLIKKKYLTTLNSGFVPEDYRSRSILLKYQSRMHSDISEFCRNNIYGGEALQDNRNLNRDWDYTSTRSDWIDVRGYGPCNNENSAEIQRIVEEIKKFANYSKTNPKKQDPEDNGCWNVAVLTYYKAQVKNIKTAIAKLTANENPKRSVYYWDDKHMRIEVYTIDKYQGKEADVVFLSMIKTGSAGLGFMDSPNRLNVALTRAKFQRYIVGSRTYFKESSKNYLLKRLEASIR